MCGIMAYTGQRRAQDVMQSGLEKLEYRGYDSCGIAVLSGGGLLVQKDRLRVSELFSGLPALAATTGIGHTRWASCGEPSASNAHPHLDCRQRIAVVHNGVVTNYQSLKTRLQAEGHHFLSDTDSEVLPRQSGGCRGGGASGGGGHTRAGRHPRR